VIPVEHRSSNIATHEGLEEYLKHWETFAGAPLMLDWTPDELKDHFARRENATLWSDGVK
jgi:hypothetical protein